MDPLCATFPVRTIWCLSIGHCSLEEIPTCTTAVSLQTAGAAPSPSFFSDLGICRVDFISEELQEGNWQQWMGIKSGIAWETLTHSSVRVLMCCTPFQEHWELANNFERPSRLDGVEAGDSSWQMENSNNTLILEEVYQVSLGNYSFPSVGTVVNWAL